MAELMAVRGVEAKLNPRPRRCAVFGRRRVWVDATDVQGRTLLHEPLSTPRGWRLPTGDWVVAGRREPRAAAIIELRLGRVVRSVKCSQLGWLALLPASAGEQKLELRWLSLAGEVIQRAFLPPLSETVDDAGWTAYAPLVEKGRA